MTWIESHQDLASSPKTKRAARLLAVPVPQVIGHLHLLWWWAVDHAFDGDLADFDALDIADAAGWDGDPDEFVAALVGCGPGSKAGFLDDDGGALAIHDWREHTAPLRAKREASAKAHHARWHVGRGVVEPDCRLCAAGGGQAGTGEPDAPDAGAPAPHSDADAPAMRPHALRSAPTEPGPTEPEQEEEGARWRLWDELAHRCDAARWAELSTFPGRPRLLTALHAIEHAGWSAGQAADALLAGSLDGVGSVGAVLTVRAEAMAGTDPPPPPPGPCPDCRGAGIVWDDDGREARTCAHPRARDTA